VLAVVNGKIKTVLSTCAGSGNAGVVGDDSLDLEDWGAEPSVNAAAGFDKFAEIEFEITDKVKNNKSVARFAYNGEKYTFISGDERMKDCGYSQ